MNLYAVLDAWGLREFATAFTDPANLVGNIAYVLLIVSMLMRTMHWLRFFAIAAGSLSAVYYYTLGDAISLFWESLFTLVNAIQLTILAIENRRGRFSAEEHAFIEKVLKGVERAQIRKLMHLGAWTEVGAGYRLIEEDTEPSHLIYIFKGEALVEREGRKVGNAGPGDFLGEMSYLSGRFATATVTAATPLRYLAFDRGALRAHLGKNIETRHAMEAAFNRNLVEKLIKTSRDLHATGAIAALDAADADIVAHSTQVMRELSDELAELTEQATDTNTPGKEANQ